jgi:endoglucanase
MNRTVMFPSNHRHPIGAAILSLFATALVALHAQNTDFTDTAPGVGANDTKPAATDPAKPTAATGPSLNANGDFSAATKDPKKPDGWNWDKDAPVSLEAEDGKHFLRLVSLQPRQLVQASQTIALKPDVKGLELSARYRIANFKFGSSFVKDIRLLYQFLDAQGKPLPKAGGGIVIDSHAKTWTGFSRRFLVPEGAAGIEIKPCLNEVAAGTLDLQEIRLVALRPEEATAMSAAVAAEIAKKEATAAETLKRKDEDAAAVLQILALPSKTQELKVSGNKLVTADGKTVWLQGVNVPSMEWSAKGENILQSMKVALDEWKANVVRLPVMDGFWFGRGKPPQTNNDQEAYRKTVDDAVKMAAARGAWLILDLHRFGAPEQGAVDFWKDAAARYKNNPAVIFDVFNEPTGISWDIWQKGGEVKVKQKDKPEPRVFQSPGMQALVDAVRSTGAKNIIVAGGLGYAYDLSGILKGYALEDKTGNGIMYATHFYNWHKGWQNHFLDLADKYPLLVGETGADIHKMSFIPAKNQEDPYTWVPDALGLMQKYHLNWTAFSMHPKATPVLINNWAYEPSPFWGAFVKEALAGKPFEMKKLR